MKTFLKLTAESVGQIRGRYDKLIMLEPQYYAGYGYLLNADVLENELFRDVWPVLEECEAVTLSAAEIRGLVLTSAEEEMRARLRAELLADPEVIQEILSNKGEE